MLTTYELEVNGYFHYVDAKTEAEAIDLLLASMTKTERRWAHIIPTGRNR